MNPFVSRITGNSWVLPVSALSLVLGFMMTLAWMNQGQSRERISRIGPDSWARYMTSKLDVVEENKSIQEEVEKLRQDNTKLQNAMASTTNTGKVLNEGLQESKRLSGLTEVQGPGLTVTLRDSTKPVAPGQDPLNAIIHDYDVLRVVNELWAAGAEAISVNKHRVGSRTYFTCVGPVIHVDGVPIGSPVMITAIGDPKSLEGGMNTRIGTLQEIRASDPNMVEVSEFQMTRLPAFAGSTAFKYATVPKETK